MRILYGTGNKEKAKQVEEYFRAINKEIEMLSLKDIEFIGDIEETGKTFEENSMIKANAIKEFCDKKGINEIIVTDDAGLCVDVLEGRPGVHTARYAGDHAPQKEAIDKLLQEMKDVPEEKRTADFVCVLTAILPNGEVLTAKGITHGKIAKQPGTMGKLTFGPVFIPDGFQCVMNDMKEEDLGITHREKAFLELIPKIEERIS